MAVRVETLGDVAVVTLDSPPVNAIGRAEREGLLAAVEAVAADDAVVAAVLTGAGRAFAAGANAAEFDLPPEPPHLPAVVDAIEASAKPWVAAIDGPALGGGYELALACRERIASPRSVAGLPEVTLGVVPGAGGTQRLPRLIGFAAAIELIVEGKTLKAAEARQRGLIDAIVDDPRAAALDAARALAGTSWTPVSARPQPDVDAAAVAKARATAGRKLRGQVAPEEAIALVETAAATDFAAGVAIERAAFLRLRESEQAKALRHIFFAERAARRPPELKACTAREIGSAVVIGGGTMGAGIAYALNAAGIAVALVENDAAGLERAQANVGRLFDAAVSRGLMTVEAAADRRGRIAWTTDLDQQGDADLAIEAVFEDLAVKQEVFRRLDSALRPGALLATNTSYLDVNRIAAVTGRPEDVIGLHFFSPAHIMKLLEVVRADRTSNDTLATGLGLAAKLGKVPVISGVCDGFIGNRILARYREVADIIMIEGALPWEIDAAMVDFGFAMGLYATQDLSGLDIAYANRKRLAPTLDPKRRYVPIADRVVESGRLGRKTGAGWYRYPDGATQGVVDPELEALVLDEAQKAGVTRRPFGADEIRSRILAVMVNEAAEILREGIAARPSDIDVVEVFGYGFPRWRGGLLWHADRVGLAAILADLERYAAEDPIIWPVSPLLRDLVRQGRTFATLEQR